MITVLWWIFCAVSGVIAGLVAVLVCIVAWELFSAIVDRIGGAQ